MIPNAKMEALENAPPANESNIPRIPSLAFVFNCSNPFGSTPGKTICEPTRYTSNNKRVYTILLRNSSMLQIFFRVCMSFFTGKNLFKNLLKRKKTHFHASGKYRENLLHNFNRTTRRFNSRFCFFAECVYFESKFCFDLTISKDLHLVCTAD